MSWTRNEEMETAKKKLAQEAMILLEQAEQQEQQEEWAKAAYIYQQAAEKLQKSGYAIRFIEDLYTKVTNLNSRIKQVSKKDKILEKQHVDTLQQQAFTIMDLATKLKNEKRFNEAVDHYLHAVNLLTEAGWSPTQLEGIRGEISSLQGKIANRLPAQQPSKISAKQIPSTVEPVSMPIGMPDDRVLTLKKFEERRSQEDEIQQAAFKAIEDAKAYSQKSNFDGAIRAFNYAIEQLNSIGWTNQTIILLQEVKELEKLRSRSKQEASQKISPSLPPTQTPVAIAESTTRIQGIAQFEEKRKIGKDLINQAFVIIEQADRDVQKENWDGAIEKYNHAIDLFNKSGWQGQTAPLYAILTKLRQEKSKGTQAVSLKSPITVPTSYSTSAPALDESNLALQSQLETQFAARRESVAAFEHRKIQERDAQEKAFAIIQEGQDCASRQQFEAAAQKYIEAISLLNSIGWQQETQQLQAALGVLQDRKKQLEIQQQSALQQQIVHQRDVAAMQVEAFAQISEEQEKMRQRQASFQEIESYKRKVDEVKTKAFSLLEDAERARSSRPPDFLAAIKLYEEAQQLLASISWQDQVARLKETLATIHQEYDSWKLQQAALTQRQLEETIARTALEEQIRNRMEEDAHLKEKQMKTLLDYQDHRNKELLAEDEAMKVLEDAKQLRNQSHFLEAMDKYKLAAQLFQNIGWDQQIIHIQREMQATDEQYAIWQEDEKLRQQEKQLQAQKVKEREIQVKQEVVAMEKMSLDLKSMIKKASNVQEQKEIQEKVQSEDDYHKFLDREKGLDADRKSLLALKQELRRELLEQEVKVRDEKERTEREKAKSVENSLKDMIRKATKPLKK